MLSNQTVSFLSTLSTLSVIANKMVRAISYLAGLVQLLFCLLCAIVSEYGPEFGRVSGRIAGKTYRISCQYINAIRAAYQSETCQQIVSIVDYKVRQFISQQFGDYLPAVSVKIAPAIVIAEETPDTNSFTRRDLLMLAKDLQVVNYSRLDTDSLRLAIAGVC